MEEEGESGADGEIWVKKRCKKKLAKDEGRKSEYGLGKE